MLRASADEHPGLFWAIRGGGGNFGVVTSFEFALHEVDPMVQLGLFLFSPDQGGEMLRFAREYIRSLPGDYGVFLAGLSAPPAPFVPEHLQGQELFCPCPHGEHGYYMILEGESSEAVIEGLPVEMRLGTRAVPIEVLKLSGG